MSHYISPNLLVQPPTKLFCQMAGCNLPIPPEPYPPIFTLLRYSTAELSPSKRDERRFFCSEEHRDQCWRSEQGWIDRRVAMPSERAVVGPTAWTSHPSNPNRSGPQNNIPGSQGMGVSQCQSPWARYGPPTPPTPAALNNRNSNQNGDPMAMSGRITWVPGYGWYTQPAQSKSKRQ